MMICSSDLDLVPEFFDFDFWPSMVLDSENSGFALTCLEGVFTLPMLCDDGVLMGGGCCTTLDQDFSLELFDCSCS